jgi:hypothetical protein
VGRDAGELAGLGRTLGVTATDDVEAILALRPDCVVHTAMADNRLMEALDDLPSPGGRDQRRLQRAGVPPVPRRGGPDEMIEPIRTRRPPAGSSLWVNGIDPGFANDWLPLVLTSVCERIDEVRCLEILNYATYDQAMVIFDIMGFGRPSTTSPCSSSPRC